MAIPLIGHLDSQFIQIMDGVKEMLRQLFRTENELTFAVSATGSAGMETCFVNLLLAALRHMMQQLDTPRCSWNSKS